VPLKESHAFPDRTDSIDFYTDLVRGARASDDIAATRNAYTALVESWKQQNANSGGAFETELDAVRREYSDFVKTDPDYQVIRDGTIKVLKQRSGILQTELYEIFSDVPKAALQYALYFAADHGVIVRTKKGRSYQLSLPDAGGT
jgi:hypothetical protein